MNKVVAGTTARTKNTRRLLKSVLPCTLFNDKFFLAKNLLLHGTTDIHVRSEIPFAVSLLK